MNSELKASSANILLSMLNVLFHLIHLGIIFFFLFGWLWQKTLLPHFFLSILILLSWCGLGLFYGFGYCLVTDIQWKIKKRMGEEPSTEYYIKSRDRQCCHNIYLFRHPCYFNCPCHKRAIQYFLKGPGANF
jgi:hypothetical protein